MAAPFLIPIITTLMPSVSAGAAHAALAGIASAASTAAIYGGTALAVGGAIQGGRAASAQAKSQQNMANYNAAVMDREATALRQKSRFDQIRQAEKAERVQGTLRARLAKGGGLGSPVAEDLEAEQMAELELENLLIGYEGQIGAERARSQAQLDRIQGDVYSERGKNLKTASYYQAGASLLTGFGKA